MQPRVLPERPDLDYLKNEAKALLKALRKRDSSLKLTDAQRQLAREYGFATWAKLRSHVMAVRTTDTDAVETFLSAIQDGDRTRAIAIAEQHPSIVGASIHVAASLGAADDVKRIVKGRPAAVRQTAGAPPAEPLLYLCFSPFHGESDARDAGLLDGARALLAAGADPNTPDGRHGVAALYGVTGMHSVPPIARLLLEAGANPTDGESVFHAAERFHEEALDLLWEFGVQLNHVGDWGNTPLYYLLRWYDPERDERPAKGIEWLLAHGADPNVPSGKEQENSLHVAVRRGLTARLVKKLLSHGADVNARRGDGSTAWMLATRGGYDALAALFEEAGAKPQPLTGADRLLAACGHGDAAAAQRLSSPATIVALPRMDQLLLCDAAAAGRTSVAVACIAAGFDVDLANDRGATALHEAAIGGYSEIVNALLSAHARHDIRDPHHHSTALGWALFGADAVANPRGKYEETVQALLDAGANVQPDEYTPKHEGVRKVLAGHRR